jgi:hypothetical protein
MAESLRYLDMRRHETYIIDLKKKKRGELLYNMYDELWSN